MSGAGRAALPAPSSLIAPAALALGSAAFTVWQNLQVTALVDLAYIVNIATRIAAGDAPYADFPLAQAPLTFLIQALLIKVFGPYYPVQIAYAAIAGGLATALTYGIVRRLLPREVTAPRTLALILTVPLVPLGIYGVLPNPFYDSDACLVVLAAIAALLFARRRSGPWAWLLAGALLTVPVFIKQNIGGAFLLATLGVLAIEALARPAARAGLRWYLTGLAVAVAVELLLIQLFIGVPNYLHWTLGFAMSGRGLAAQRISAFTDPGVIWPGLLLLSVILIASRSPTRLRGAIFIAGLLVPLGFGLVSPPAAPVATLLFPGVLIAATVLAVIRSLLDGPDLESLLPLILLATTLGALMSQGLGASTYGIFPLLVLAIAFIVREVSRHVPRPLRIASLTGVALSALLTVSGTVYVLTNARLLFVDVNAAGPVMRSSFPSLAGLSARGPYVADLDEVLFWIEENVPADEPMVFLPGEDPAFFALGRPPRLPSVYFYDVANPYSPAEVAAFADQVGLRWVFVKDRLQLREEPPLNQQLVRVLTDGATMVARVSAYRVYRR